MAGPQDWLKLFLPRQRGNAQALATGFLLFASSVIPAFGQQAKESAKPSTESTSPQAAPARPHLSPQSAKEVADARSVIQAALSPSADISQIKSAIPRAERVLQIRTTEQGQSWWETLEAAEDLADLRQLASMASDERKRLDDARNSEPQAAKLLVPGTQDKAIQMQKSVVDTEREVLGDEHRVLAGSLTNLGGLYEAMGKFDDARPYFEEAEKIREAILGGNDPDVAQSLDNLGDILEATGRYGDAEALYQRVRKIQQAAIGEENADYAATLDDLATLYVATGQDEQAESLYRRALEIEEKAPGKQSRLYARTLGNLGDLYRLMGRFPEALKAQQEALDIRKSVVGENDPDYARSLDRLAAVYDSMGHYVQAEPLYQQGLDIRQRILGEDHPDYARSVNNLAFLYKEMGRYPDSERLYKIAQRVRAAVFGEDSRTYASTLDDLAQLYFALGRYDDAECLYLQALKIRAAKVGVEHQAYAVNLNNLAILYTAKGDYADAEKLLNQGLEIWRKKKNEQNPVYAQTIVNLAQLYQTMGRYDQADSLYRQALEIQKGTVGGAHTDYATTVDSLASLKVALGQDDEAERLYLQALDIEKNAVGEDHPLYAATLCNLGDLYRLMARYKDAEPLQLKSLAIREQVLGQDDPDYARSLDRLGALYYSMGQNSRAEDLLKKSLEIRKRVLGEEHPDYARSLNDLALVYKKTNRTDKAEQLYLQALAIRKKAFGEKHRLIASSMDDLAQLYMATGKYDQAEQLFLQALEIRKNTVHEKHPAYAVNLDNLAVLYEILGKYDLAEKYCRQALDIDKEVLGIHHPLYSTTLRHLASILAATGRTKESASLLLQSAQLQWQHLTENFPIMSDQQKQQFLSQSRFVQSEELSSLAFQDKGADPKDGLQGVLLSKDLLFEAARQESGALTAAVNSGSPAWQEKWNNREKLRHEFASLAILDMSDTSRPPSTAAADREHMRQLADQIEALNQKLRRDNPKYAELAPLQMVTVADVAAALRPGEALLEYIEYRPRDFTARKWGDPHYGVFILLGGTGEVTTVDLGSAAAINQDVQMFRARIISAISNFRSLQPSQHEVRDSESGIADSSSALRSLVWQPLEKQLAGVKRVYVGPDGLLSLIPFEAMAKPSGTGGWRYLVEDKEIVYVGTGRDLARLAINRRTESADTKSAIFVSDPDFNASQQRIAESVAGVKTRGAAIVYLAPPKKAAPTQTKATLGGSRDSDAHCQIPTGWPQDAINYLDKQLTEPVRSLLRRLGWSVATLTHDGAVEEAVLKIDSPRIVQFATHGFYLECPANGQTWDNPLLRSGMVMAGANTWPKEHAVFYKVGNDLLTESQARALGLTDEELDKAKIVVLDGILTAYEVSGINLHGTDLVNLTACETGLGEVTPDGVAGLRQAFLLAGARSLTMSMWEVPAEETGAEVNDFYNLWLVGVGKVARTRTRYEAFRSAQLTALKAARQQYGGGHPFYWAGVVYVGDPGDLPTETPKPQRIITTPAD